MKTKILYVVFITLSFFVNIGATKEISGSKSGEIPLNDYVGYYNDFYSKGDYTVVDNCLFYKSNTAKIESVTFKIGNQIIKGDELIIRGIRGNSYLSTNFHITGFASNNGNCNCKYSVCTTFEDGAVFEKRENAEDYSFSDYCDFGFDYNTPSLKYGASPKILYVNFLYKDLFSNAIIQGYYKFRLIP